MIDPRAIVEAAQVGPDVRVGPFCHVHAGATLGARCALGDLVVVEADARVGEEVVLESGARIGRGVTLERGAYVGPGATLTDDRLRGAAGPGTVVREGATLGAQVTVLPGLTIGRGAKVGAGSVVTRPVPDFAVVAGVPARIVGYDVAAPTALPAAQPAPGEARRLGVVGPSLISLPRFADLRGSIAVGEVGGALPFVPRRFFTVFDVAGEHVRGEHAHRECHQLLVSAHGRMAVVVDDGRAREQVVLDRPTLALHVPPRVWTVQYGHSPGAVLLVLASHEYDAGDYVRDYAEFLRLVGTP